jgi:hypothetical protein
MLVKFLETHTVKANPPDNVTYEGGQVYDLPDSTGRFFIDKGVALALDPAHGQPPKAEPVHPSKIPAHLKDAAKTPPPGVGPPDKPEGPPPALAGRLAEEEASAERADKAAVLPPPAAPEPAPPPPPAEEPSKGKPTKKGPGTKKGKK